MKNKKDVYGNKIITCNLCNKGLCDAYLNIHAGLYFIEV